MMSQWQYSGIDEMFPKSIFRTDDETGEVESCNDDRPDVLAWIAEGNKILPAPKKD